MLAVPELLFRAWTEQCDRSFAVLGTVFMKGEVNAPFFFQTEHAGARHPHFGRFLRLHRDRVVESTWLTSATHGAAIAVTVELRAHEGGTHLRPTQAGFRDEDSKKRREQAWPMVLAQRDERMQCQT